jgi:YidC/Oxa1 family membrane protein insertase
MFSPEGSDPAAYVFDGWARGEQSASSANWAKVSGDILTPTTPVTVQYTGEGYTVSRVLSVDENYLITLDDTVTNTSGGEITLVRSGASRQHGLPDDLTNFFILQEGPIAVVDGHKVDMKYKKLLKTGSFSEDGESGWAGLTDKYWLSAAIAPQGQAMTANFEMKNYNGADVYEAGYALKPVTLSVGSSINSKGFFYTGAKRREILKGYMKDLGIARMDMAIDWGLLGPLTRPMSWALSFFGNLTGNFGVGILIITLLLKLILFPLNNKAYASQAKMKAIQPKVKKMQELYGDDKARVQKEMMAMYRKEGVNPVGGCLPMIPQMFIFFALYKSLFINIDMRHAPFIGWIKDLSAKDPLSILNGFGALPWDGVPIAALSFFAIGPLALMYGASMAAMQTLSAPAGDPMQRKIFQLMPLFFMFILAPFAAGLLVYWVWNNILTFFQQYYITRKFGVETPFDAFFGKILGKSKPKAE